jgi:hypothetical protein
LRIEKDMKKQFLQICCLIVLASCGRYSQIVKEPNKEIKTENPRVYGEVDGPARQSKQTYAAAPDAVEKSARIKDVLFGNKKSTSVSATASAPVAAVPASSADTTAGK